MMVDRRMPLSLDELEQPTSLQHPSANSLAWSALNLTKTSDIEAHSGPVVPSSTVRLVHCEELRDVKHLGKSSAASVSSPGLLPAPSVRSMLSSHSVNNRSRMEYSQPINHATSNKLHLHPFPQGSTPVIDSGCSSSSHWVNSSSSAASPPASSDLTRPPSSASFIDMGKGTHGKGSYNHQVHCPSHRWGRNVSDSIPQIVCYARKSGSRFWRSLIRPSVLPFLGKPKYPDTSSICSITGQVADLDASSSAKELPPRPAPYFYPRRVDCERDDLDAINQDTFLCDLGELPIEPPPDESKHKSKLISMPRKTGKLQGVYGDVGERDGASIDSDEIETWKKRRTDSKKSRPSLRQWLGSSLRQSIGFRQLRSTCSELDLDQFSLQQDQPESFGPGITDDPFASLLPPPEQLPAPITFLPATSTLSPSATAPLPSPSSSEPLLDFAMFNSEIKCKSFMNMDPDCDDPSTSSSISRSDTSYQPFSPFLYPKPGYLPQPDKVVVATAPTRQLRLRPVSEDSGLCHTPVLTPDLDSIEAFSPWLSDRFCAVDMTPLEEVQEPSGPAHTSIVPFPSLDSFRELPIIPDTFEESAAAEGTCQDQISYSCALGTPHLSSASLDPGGNKRPRSQRDFSLRDVGGECTAEVSLASVDMSESTDFTLLAVEWPLPPLQTPPEPDITLGDKSGLERLTPVGLLSTNQPLRTHKRDPSIPLTLDMSSLGESQADPLIKPLSLPMPGSPQSPSSDMLSSPIDIVEVTLGSSFIKQMSLPKLIVLTQNAETGLTSSSISFRAASRPVLVSFFALHAETRLEAQSVPTLANVKLCTVSDGSQVNSDTATVSLTNDSNDSQLKTAESGSISFTLDLPTTLGELAVAIAKVSFGKGLALDDM
ncbi:hypothetical protein JB92DRAFT_2854529 [Gautieria morchelliformis]|nr:hypothetical protein JB92DRAFT_2854529 [Gautieria morchelliformis]